MDRVLVAEDIILDLNLPRHDGIEILERLRDTGSATSPWWFSLPPTRSGTATGHQLGAVRFLRKPSELEQFLSLGAVFKELLEESNAASRKCLRSDDHELGTGYRRARYEHLIERP
jgi:DNA-binding response OmpR family regulator